MTVINWIMDHTGAVLAFACGFLFALVILIFTDLFGMSFWVSAIIVLGIGIAILTWEYVWDALFRGMMGAVAPKDAAEQFAKADKRYGWIGNYGLLLGMVTALIMTIFIDPLDAAGMLGFGE